MLFVFTMRITEIMVTCAYTPNDEKQAGTLHIHKQDVIQQKNRALSIEGSKTKDNHGADNPRKGTRHLCKK